MEKMYLVSSDEFHSLPHKFTDKTPESNEMSHAIQSGGAAESPLPADQEVKKWSDKKIKEQAKLRNKQEQARQNFNKKISPLLDIYRQNHQEVLTQVEESKQGPAHFVLTLISRLPKISILHNKILYDNEVLKESASNIVSEIVDNNVLNSKNVIDALRAGRKFSPVKENPSVNSATFSNESVKDASSQIKSPSTSNSRFQSLWDSSKEPFHSIPFEQEMSKYMTASSTPKLKSIMKKKKIDIKPPESGYEPDLDERSPPKEAPVVGAVEKKKRKKNNNNNNSNNNNNNKELFSPRVTRSKSKERSPHKSNRAQHGRGKRSIIERWISY